MKQSAWRQTLDVSGIGVWSQYEKSFVDIRICHPNANSYLGKSLEEVYKQNENEKKWTYSDRVLNCERASFTPLVFSMTGGMGAECRKFNSRLAKLIAEKRNEM